MFGQTRLDKYLLHDERRETDNFVPPDGPNSSDGRVSKESPVLTFHVAQQKTSRIGEDRGPPRMRKGKERHRKTHSPMSVGDLAPVALVSETTARADLPQRCLSKMEGRSGSYCAPARADPKSSVMHRSADRTQSSISLCCMTCAVRQTQVNQDT